MAKKVEKEAASVNDYPVVACKTQKEWSRWLAKNNNTLNGVWLQLFKKDSVMASVTRAESLDEALCYGWIDGQSKSLDADSWLQKFTPRRAKSIWSKRNIEHIERLEKEGRMKPAGLKAVADAKEDGRWQKAYDSPSNMKVPDDFIKVISKNKKALVFFNSLNKTNVFAITWRLQTAKKPETREKRMKSIFEMLKKGEKFY